MRQRKLIYVEGETEKVLLQDVLQVSAKVVIFNLWKEPVGKQLRYFQGSADIYVVYDTDVMNSENVKRLSENLRALKANRFLTGILQQTENLEDELVRSCSALTGKKDLHKLLNAQGNKEFKRMFCNVTNLQDKLREVGFDHCKLWCGNHIVELADFKKFRVSAEHLLKLRR